jgi:hypothetical protein
MGCQIKPMCNSDSWIRSGFIETPIAGSSVRIEAVFEVLCGDAWSYFGVNVELPQLRLRQAARHASGLPPELLPLRTVQGDLAS